MTAKLYPCSLALAGVTDVVHLASRVHITQETSSDAYAAFRAVNKGWPLPLRDIANRRSLLYVGNLVDAMLAVLEHPSAANKLYLLSDGQDVSTSQLVERMAQALNKTPRLFSLPQGMLRLAARVSGKSSAVDRLFGSLYLDSSKIQQELGWTPPFSMQQGLAETAQWFLKAQDSSASS